MDCDLPQFLVCRIQQLIISQPGVVAVSAMSPTGRRDAGCHAVACREAPGRPVHILWDKMVKHCFCVVETTT